MTIPAELSTLAATLHATVRASRRARVPLEDLRQAALAADLSFIGSPDARERLLAAIRELEAAGAITLPRGANGWEAAATPGAAQVGCRPAAAKPARAPEPTVAWHADLSWVPAFLATDQPIGRGTVVAAGSQRLPWGRRVERRCAAAGTFAAADGR